MTYLNNRSQHLPAPPRSGAGEWSSAAGGDADLIRWAAAQGQALSKLQIFSTMAKQVNEQQ
ncbi:MULTISPECIES: hypothetical protein [Massilia]|uniref:Uncharacterized protein n=2 Tax=Massilia TaxID=149698 RepID=A0ABX0LF70_9BURK|nr:MULTISPECIES: hypothetical protein [Massilia]NHZ32675.1 hypothetical protein [Massilia rubra]NHZ91134.1 hypothetical protein [Massilia mucilaginosa]NHZ94499.1 hypothetical protein [Massilia sp. CCM 8734]